MMVWVEALIPFDKGELLSIIHQVGMVEKTVSVLSFFFYAPSIAVFLHCSSCN